MSVLGSLPLAEREEKLAGLEDRLKQALTQGGTSLSERAVLDKVAAESGFPAEDVAFALSRLGIGARG